MNEVSVCYFTPLTFSSYYMINIPIGFQNIQNVQSFNLIDKPEEIPLLEPPQRNIGLTKQELMQAGYERKKKVWTAEQDQNLLQLIGEKEISWKQIQNYMPQRTEKMCYSRYRRLMAQARKRWKPEQESLLRQLVQTRGYDWKNFTSYLPNRTWKQLRDKYLNYLNPQINHDQWDIEEDLKILDLLQKFGTKWKQIQKEMPNRTDNQIKNRYYGRLKVLLKKKARRKNFN